MRRFSFTILVCAALLLVVVACDSPKPSATKDTPAAASIAPSAPASSVAAPALGTYAPVASIDDLVATLAGLPAWNNGGFSAIDLPENADVTKVMDRALALRATDDKTPPHRILETRKVLIGGAEYIACRVEVDGRRKIFLLRWLNAKTGWWSRSWDAV